MKKFIALLLVSLLVFSFAGCMSETPGPSSEESGTSKPTSDGDGFVMPTWYAAILSVSINPQFQLYLDEEGVTIALEPMNEDAKSIAANIDVVNKDLEATMLAILSAVKNGGFVSDEATMTCEVVGVLDTVDGAQLLNRAQAAVRSAADALEITLQGDSDDALALVDPRTALISESEYGGNMRVDGDLLLGSALSFYPEDEVDGPYCLLLDPVFESQQSDPNQKTVTFEEKNYYRVGAGMTPHYMELTETEIIVKGSFYEGDADAVTMKLSLRDNGTLLVTESNDEAYPQGTVLSIGWDEEE